MNSNPQNFIEVTGPVRSVTEFKTRHFSLASDFNTSADEFDWALSLEPGLLPSASSNEHRLQFRVSLPQSGPAMHRRAEQRPVESGEAKLTFSFQSEPANILSIIMGLSIAHPSLCFYGEIVEPDSTTTYVQVSDGGNCADVGNPRQDAWALEQSYLD